MAKIECPACYFVFESEDDLIEGEVLSCPDCGVDLEVIEINDDGVKVEEAEMAEEDWGE